MDPHWMERSFSRVARDGECNIRTYHTTTRYIDGHAVTAHRRGTDTTPARERHSRPGGGERERARGVINFQPVKMAPVGYERLMEQRVRGERERERTPGRPVCYGPSPLLRQRSSNQKKSPPGKHRMVADPHPRFLDRTSLSTPNRDC